MAAVIVAVMLWLTGAGQLFAAPDPEIGALAGKEQAAPANEHPQRIKLGHKLPIYSVVPFVLLLGCIAVMPLANGHWWEHNRNKAIVVAILAIPMILHLGVGWDVEGRHQLLHTLAEYLQFLMLLGSLFVISGGIYVRGTLTGTPAVNATILGLGAVIASFLGTTGASMLLIRPLLRANASRTRRIHTLVMFIFMVSNCGGLLTPLGDPPLYLGFLNGVPFIWTFRLWKEWAVVNGSLLLIYYVWDRMAWRGDFSHQAASVATTSKEPLRIEGAFNLLLLIGIVAVIFASGNGLLNGGVPWAFPVAEGVMLTLLLTSYFGTARRIHELNAFSFGPINEVAILFFGIFATMIPALLILNARGGELKLSETWQFFWASGMLSSVLDNAPTYLTFAATACGLHDVDVNAPGYLSAFLQKEHGPALLAAISCGSVFMGANTYIGNGPNLMVKAIAEQSGVKMPGFFRYMLYSGCILLPLFGLVTWLFFR